MATLTKNYNFKKDALDDFYSLTTVNGNLDKIDETIKMVQTEAENKDGGNAATVGGKTALELQNYNNLTNKPTSLPANGGNAATVGGKSAEDFFNVFTVSDARVDGLGTKTGFFKVASSGISGVSFSVGRTSIDAADGNSYDVEIFCRLWGVYAEKLLFRYDILYLDDNSWEQGTAKRIDDDFLLKNGDGSGLTNVNAVTLGGRSAEDFYTKTPVAISVETNPITLSNGIYKVEGELTTDNGYPTNGWNCGTIFVSGAEFGEYGYRVIKYIQLYTNTEYVKLQQWNSWTDWFSLRDAETVSGKTVSQLQDYNNLTNTPSSLPANGGDAQTVNKATRTFNYTKGSWYRLATNKKGEAGGVFVLSVRNNTGYGSTTVFSASRQWSTSKGAGDNSIKVLSHSAFNGCVTNLRMATKYDDNQYIDFYIGYGSDNTGSIEVQFFGKGWDIFDNIETANVLDGYNTKEFELIE